MTALFADSATGIAKSGFGFSSSSLGPSIVRVVVRRPRVASMKLKGSGKSAAVKRSIETFTRINPSLPEQEQGVRAQVDNNQRPPSRSPTSNPPSWRPNCRSKSQLCCASSQLIRTDNIPIHDANTADRETVSGLIRG